MPTYFIPQLTFRFPSTQLRKGVVRLGHSIGPDPAHIEVLAFGRPGQSKDRQASKDAELAGADRVTIWLDQNEKEAVLIEI